MDGRGVSEGDAPQDGAAPVSAAATWETSAGGEGPFEWVHRGLGLLDRGDAWAAAVLLERAAANEPASSSVREALSRAYFDSGRFEQAAASFHELVALAPTSDYAHFGLGLALTRLDRFELAIEHLAMAVAMRPDRHEYVERLRQAKATLSARRGAHQDLSS